MKVFRGTKKLLRAIAASLPRIVDLLAFIAIIFAMFAVLGRDMFAARLERFNDFTTSMITLAAVFVSDAWSDFMWEGSQVRCLRGTSADAAADVPVCASIMSEVAGAVFFIVFFFVCQYVLVALFVAVILDKVSGVSSEDEPYTHMEAFLVSIWAGIKGAAVRVAAAMRLFKPSELRVVVCVEEAQDLMTAEMKEELCDTFVRVRNGRELRQTHVYQDAFSPVWNALVAPFHIHEQSRDNLLRFQVLNSHITDMYELLGECSMHWDLLQTRDNLVTSEEDAANGFCAWELDHFIPLKMPAPDDDARREPGELGEARGHQNPRGAADGEEDNLLPANLQAIDDMMKQTRAIEAGATEALSLPWRYAAPQLGRARGLPSRNACRR